MQWIECEEHLPQDQELYYTYSAVHGRYQAAKWTPTRGWVDQTEGDLRIITHWLDQKLPHIFPILGTADEEVAKKYNYPLTRGIFGLG